MKEALYFVISGLFKVALRPKRMTQIIKNLILDIKYAGTYLGVPLCNEHKKEGFTNTTSSEYDVLNQLFSKLIVSIDDIIVDIGCGNGRVLGWLAAQYPNNKVVGIEIDAEVAADTKKRMRKYRQVKVITGNVLDNDMIKEGTIFYLFHPFHEQSMRQFVSLLKKTNEFGASSDPTTTNCLS